MNQAGSLLDNLLLFGRLLRSLEVEVDTGRLIDLSAALKFIDIGRRDEFYDSLRCLLIHHQEDLALFDEAFDLFWKKPVDGKLLQNHRSDGEVKRSRRPAVEPPPLGEANPFLSTPSNRSIHPDELPPVVQATLTYSDQEVLRHKDFAELAPDEIQAIKRWLAHLDWQPGLRRTRRYEPGAGPRYDFRRSLRGSLHDGGEVLAWKRKERKQKARPLVILADVSGSMERYTRLLMHFAYSLNKTLSPGVETFVFSTRLSRITRQIRHHNVDHALSQVSQTVNDWSGGTRIGESLRTFNYSWARRTLSHGAVVLLISDGWDRGDIDVLRVETQRLQRSCNRLIWLNPLLGNVDFEPLTRGMAAALPYVDDFLPVHNLASLEDLAVHLRKIGG